MGIEELKAKMEPFKNTLVIEFLSIARFVEVIECEDDHYFLFDTGSGRRQVSCLIDFVPLKGQLPDKDYESLVCYWNHNNTEKAV